MLQNLQICTIKLGKNNNNMNEKVINTSINNKKLQF